MGLCNTFVFKGNDISSTPNGLLKLKLKNPKQQLLQLFHSWSAILHFLVWRHSNNTHVMNRTRLRTNRAMISFMLQQDKVILHPDFQDRNSALFSDSIHLLYMHIATYICLHVFFKPHLDLSLYIRMYPLSQYRSSPTTYQ